MGCSEVVGTGEEWVSVRSLKTKAKVVFWPSMTLRSNKQKGASGVVRFSHSHLIHTVAIPFIRLAVASGSTLAAFSAFDPRCVLF